MLQFVDIQKVGNIDLENIFGKHIEEIEYKNTSESPKKFINIEPPNMINRLFDMMEKMAERMEVLENQT